MAHASNRDGTLPVDPDVLLNERQAAILLGHPVRTLQAWRYRGGGPKFVKASRSVRYRRRDLLAWIEAATLENTSQGGAA
jgi:hypothetical protein